MEEITKLKPNIFPGKRLYGKNRYKRLYHFTSFETFKLIWENKSLKFSELTGVNDILESDYSIKIDNQQQIPLLFAFDDMRKQYKQISLTMDKDTYIKGAMSTLLWGIYGDKRKGVCIELDFDKIKFTPTMIKGIVRYRKNIPRQITLDSNLKTINDIKRFILSNSIDLMFTKTNEWAGEREYRILSNADKYLDISDAIVSVVVTDYNLPTFDKLVELIDNKVSIKVLTHDKNTIPKIAIPNISDALVCRKQEQDAMNNPNNSLLKLSQQAKEHYEILKDNPNADITKQEYSL